MAYYRIPVLGECEFPSFPRLLLLFVGLNYFILAADISVAHAANRFQPWQELIPIGYVLIAGLVSLAEAVMRRVLLRQQRILQIVFGIGVLVGVLGFWWHLRGNLGNFLGGEFSWDWLFYGAPLVAPLSIAGVSLVGMLAIYLRGKCDERGDHLIPPWSMRIFFLLLGLGFLGNFMLGLEHIQSNFIPPIKWVPVAGALFFFLLSLSMMVKGWGDLPRVRKLFRLCMTLSLLIGTLGFLLHLKGGVHPTSEHFLEDVLYSTPLFAPLLFADLGMFGWLLMLDEKNS